MTQLNANRQLPSTHQNRDQTAFVNNAQKKSAKTKSNLIHIPSITFPKGGGAIKSIDEKFSVAPSSGTASFSIPLPFSSGRNGIQPAVSLGYSSGTGNSVFGIGWDLNLPHIQRRLDKKLPEYKDSAESDTFLFSGAEDLVPELIKDNNNNWIKNRFQLNTATITRYRPRVESLFSRIEKIEDAGNVYWQVRSKSNEVFVFGKSDVAKLYSPVAGEGYKIFKWCLEYSYDDKGHFTRYNYKKENADNIVPEVYEKNRLNQMAAATNLYLRSVQYGNKTAWYEGDALPTDFLFELVFDYGEHNDQKPTTQEEFKWSLRQDPFSDYRTGFEIRTYRLCKRILMFHHFANELGWEDYLVRSMEFVYDQTPNLTYLEKIIETAYIWNTDGSLRSKKSLPPLEFSYRKPGFSREVKEIVGEDIQGDPVGLDDQIYHWTDLYSEGISGILTEQATGWYYKENLGNGIFSLPKQVNTKPSFRGLTGGSLVLQELEANGKKYAVIAGSGVKGYFELTADEEWESFYPFDTYPEIDLKDPNLKFIDINGDGMPDILISRDQEFVWYASKGKQGYDDPEIAAKVLDAEKGPMVLFSNADHGILVATADMSGDGLADIVVISASNVHYYPNLGYGRFGARVTMAMKDCFDSSSDFNPSFIHLTDIDGSGTTDIIYTGKGKVQLWFNQSGNSFSDPSEFFNPFPETDNQSKISFVDLLGNGTKCMVWSSALPGNALRPLRYIDIMKGNKPHIMIGHKNNRGKEMTIEYRSSVQYYLDDKRNGIEWITKLPFPVQCVSKVTTEDKVSQSRLTTEYNYHHGFYDAVEREFRGFARTETRDSENFENYIKNTETAGAANTTEQDLFQPAVITKNWFHTGAFINREKILHQLQEEYYPQSLLNKTGSDNLNGILPKDAFPGELSAMEIYDACRSLKGLPLRQEIYSEEGDEQVRPHPYTVVHTNYNIQKLQPRRELKYAVFFVHAKETIGFHYERNPEDPRISHQLNIEIDGWGNVLQQALIVYGRKKADHTLPTDKDREKQTKQQLIYTVNRFTSIIDTNQAYRLPLICETQSFELNTAVATSGFFRADELSQRFAWAANKLYEQETAVNEKRKIEHSRTVYLKNDLSGFLPLGSMDSMALASENYLLAFTPTLVQTIYGGKFDENSWRNKAHYVRSEGDDNYWIRSGRTYFHPNTFSDPFVKTIAQPTAADINFARSNFYLPVVYEDNFGNLTKMIYDSHKLFVAHIVDAMDNETKAMAFNYRVLSPYLLQDANDNRSGVRFDEESSVTHLFFMGKENEFTGDAMDISSTELSQDDHPSTVVEYDFFYFDTNGKKPDRVKTTIFEKHYYKDPQPSGGLLNWLASLFGSGLTIPEIEIDRRSQVSYSYFDGSGRQVLKKVQAETGIAPERNADGVLLHDNSGKLQYKNTTPELRWTGNGRTIFNNKGNAVKQYEPYFDSSFEYNDEKELVELGFSSILKYDAPGRVIEIRHANGTFSKVEFDAWLEKHYDENDTVVDSRWYAERLGGAKGEAEQQAAQKAAVHYNTASIRHMDVLGNAFLLVRHNKSQRSNETVQEEFYYSRADVDIEGNVRNKIDARGNVVMSWKYDLLGNICFQRSMDAGDRWILQDVMGKPLTLWDSRLQTFSYEYDALHRPLQMFVNSGTGAICYEKYEYGENLADNKTKNLRGNLWKHYDTAALTVNEAYDFKANLLGSSKNLVKNYKQVPDWQNNPELETETFTTETAYDALNRVMKMVAPDDSVFIPGYNEANLLNSVDVAVKDAGTATNFVSNINYNAKRQREEIFFGNGTKTSYFYEPETYHLVQLLTTGDGGSRVLQDLSYTYDAAGNVTRQFDNAQKTIFYGGQRIEAQTDYIYDALYHLIEANGREHAGQLGFNAQDNCNDDWCRLKVQPNSPVQMRNYSQKYYYDGAGNILKMQHAAGALNSWTRLYNYNAANNQLIKASVGNQSYTYTYNEHGSMLTVPHLAMIEWNFREEMQHVSLGGGGEAHYTYDSNGQRVRKIIERTGNKTEERIYLGVFEVYRERTGNTVTLERETLHVMDDEHRIAIVDTRTKGNDGTDKQLIRYQYNNHLDMVCLELDDQARVITYEEYHPFGTTAYQATDASRQVAKKRYRYTGMERDEESGFNYHRLRYYMPWIGRWCSADPIGIGDGTNVYAYLDINPILFHDPSGTQKTKKKKKTKAPKKQPAKKGGSSGKKSAGAPKPATPAVTGNGKILVVMHNTDTTKTPSAANEFDQNVQAAKKAGYTVITAKSGKDLLDKLSKVGTIKQLTILSHGVPTGIGGEQPNSGLYVNDHSAGHEGKDKLNAGGATVAELKQKVDSGAIKFASDAKIIIGGCRTVNTEGRDVDDTIAGKVSIVTGKEVTASSGRTSPAEKEDTTPDRSTGGAWHKIKPDGKGGATREALPGKDFNVAP